jgi:hypothetical protein
MQMVESRRADRVRTFLRARIVFNNQNSTIDCTVKNISSTGAKIELSDGLTVPEIFDLVIPQKGRTYRAQIAWRGTESMGVRFVRDENASKVWETPESKVEQLERENRRLRQQVVALTKRLEECGQAVDAVF